MVTYRRSRGQRQRWIYLFSGPQDDMIVSGGENVYPDEVEETILSHAKVAYVALITLLFVFYFPEIATWFPDTIMGTQ